MQELPELEALLSAAQRAHTGGDMETAILHMRQACSLAPRDAAIRTQFASLLAACRRWAEALEQFDVSLRLRPDDGHTWYLAGLALLNVGRYPQAVSAIARSMQRLRLDQRINAAFAEALFNGGLPDAALPWWRTYAAAHPHDASTQLRLGEMLSRNGLHEEALQHFALLPEADASSAASKYMAIAQVNEDVGDRSGAARAYSHALSVRPHWGIALAGILQLQQAQVTGDLEGRARELLAQPTLPANEGALLNYALGKIHDARGEYGSAIECWHEANRLRRQLAGEPDEQALLQRVASIIRHTAQLLSDLPALPPVEQDMQIVFIVGMPRSGTTLTERILGSHSSAHGAGELAELPLLARSLWPELQGYAPGAWDTPLTRQSLLAARNAYLRAIRRGAGSDKRLFVDKAPLNFFNLWLASALFPDAKVVWCRRDPRDVGVSIYSENFAIDERLCTRLDGIGHYINAQQRLMAHWTQTLPMDFHEVCYEKLVDAPEQEARALFQFAGLEWEPACLDFHKRQDGVQTPSRWQVRQPIHSRSCGRWRHYAESLSPLISALDQVPV